jgi:hypothetical protein
MFLQQIVMSVVTVATGLIRRRGPLGLGRLAALFVGIRRSFELDVDPRTSLYRPLT